MAGRKTSKKRSTTSRSASSRSKSGGAKRRTTKGQSNGRSAGRPKDALGMLREDHERVSALFDRFEQARGSASKQKLASQICAELELHTRLEEEIFYPQIREAIGEELLMNEATVEHQSAKDLIAQIKDANDDDALFEARVTVLGEYIKHHVREEQNEMFPKVRESDVDVRELGEQMRERKAGLLNGSGGEAMARAEA